MGKGSGRRKENYALVTANLAKVKSSPKCPSCGSYNVHHITYDDDVEYGDGLMAVEWTECECLHCEHSWTLE